MKWKFRTKLQLPQNFWLGGYRPQIPVLSVLYPQLNLLNPPPEQKSWVRHSTIAQAMLTPIHVTPNAN